VTNDKTSWREDEQRKQEDQPLVRGAPLEGRTEPYLSQDTQDLEPGRRPLTAEPAGGAPSIDEVDQQSDFARWFRPSELPAAAPSLLRTAREEGAPECVIEALEPLDPTRCFATISEVWRASRGRPQGA
jgi:hypothetical protein